MNEKNRIKNEINREFKVWWEKNGYKYIPENDEEGDWCVVVRYWAWKGFEAGRISHEKLVLQNKQLL